MRYHYKGYIIPLTIFKMKEYKIIRYVEGAYTDSTGYTTLKFKCKRVVGKCVKRYTNTMQKTAKLPPADRNLLDFITEEMKEEENEIVNFKEFRDRFILHMSKNCGLKYSHQTVHKGFQHLKKVGLLILRKDSRKAYTVNPLHFFNGTDFRRRKLLKTLINEACEIGIEGIITRKALGI